MIGSTAPLLSACFERMFEASWQAGLLALAILLIQKLLRARLSPQWRCALWMLVFVRLAMPVLPESHFSFYRFGHEPSSTAAAPVHPIIRFFEPGDIDAPSPIVVSTSSPVTKTHALNLTFTEMLAGAWLAGVVVIVSRGVIACMIQVRQTASTPPIDDGSAHQILDDACRALRLKHPPRLIETDRVTTPALCGWLRPVILLPAGLRKNISCDGLRFILLHELAHLKRRDIPIGWIVWLLCTAHWFNPLVWLAARWWRNEVELACDARVVAAAGRDRWRSYGHTILNLLDPLQRPRTRLGMAGVVESTSLLRRRIHALANPVRATPLWSGVAGLLLVALGCGTLTAPRRTAPASAPSHGLETRTYDIRDLLRISPQTEFEADKFGWPSTRPSTQPAADRQELVAEFIKLIKKTIDPPSWRGPGSIQEKNGHLIVTQTPANHDKVQRLLTMMRKNRSIQITVEARILKGDALWPAVEAIGRETGARWIDLPDGLTRIWSHMATAEEIAPLLVGDPQGVQTTLTAPRLTLFNSQRACVVVADETAYTAGYRRSPDSGEFEPLTEIVHPGVVIDCMPTVSDDQKYVTLTLNPRLTTLLDLTEAPWPDAPAGREDLKIQVPHTLTASFALPVTVSVPNDRVLLLRTMPVRQPPADNAPPAEPVLMMFRQAILASDQPGRR